MRGLNELILEHALYTTAAGQAIPGGGAQTIVNFNTQGLDPYSRVSVGAAWKYTCVSDGHYMVATTITLDSAAVTAGQQFSPRLYKNGVQVKSLGAVFFPAAGTCYVSASGSVLIYLVKNDYIDIRAYNDNAAARALAPDANFNHISISRIGRAI